MFVVVGKIRDPLVRTTGGVVVVLAVVRAVPGHHGGGAENISFLGLGGRECRVLLPFAVDVEGLADQWRLVVSAVVPQCLTVMLRGV